MLSAMALELEPNLTVRVKLHGLADGATGSERCTACTMYWPGRIVYRIDHRPLLGVGTRSPPEAGTERLCLWRVSGPLAYPMSRGTSTILVNCAYDANSVLRPPPASMFSDVFGRTRGQQGSWSVGLNRMPVLGMGSEAELALARWESEQACASHQIAINFPRGLAAFVDGTHYQ